MSSIDNIVTVNITRETQTIDQESFGIPLFLDGALTVSSGTRVRTYSSLDAVVTDFATTTPAYKMAAVAFSQPIHPDKIKIATKTEDETFTEALDAVKAIDNDWYGLATVSIEAADIVEIAQWVEANKKIYIARSADADIITNATDDVASDLESVNYDRTAVIYHPSSATMYPDAAWLADCLVLEPGSETWKFRTLTGITPVSLTDTQRENALNKNVNIYEKVAGVNITGEGTVASGEFIDIIRGIDWLTARMKERVYSRLINAPKIPFTNKGIAIIEAAVRQQLDIAVEANLIAPEPKYTVTVPDVLKTDELDRQNRILKGVSFKARLAGAIHKVNIVGTVSA